jgi:hypothetical protein
MRMQHYDIASNIFYVVRAMPIARQRVAKHVHATMNTSIAVQRAIIRIEEELFSMWFAYVHCWATDVFPMGSPREYINSPVVNQKSVVERE